MTVTPLRQAASPIECLPYPTLIGDARRRVLPFIGDPVFEDPQLRSIPADAFAGFPEPIEDLAVPGLIAAPADHAHRVGAASVPRHFPVKALYVAHDLLNTASGH